jgi:fluoroacetyl-CoA thioesterase
MMMKSPLITGIRLTQTKVVTFEDTAAKYGSGFLEVFATPALLAFMEHTSLLLVQPYLEPGFGTVGTTVNITHLKATPVNVAVECTSTLINIDGNSLTFNVIVSDNIGKIGEGTHSRFIIDEERFMKKFQNENSK